MKKSYREQFDEIEFKKNYKKEVSDRVLNYEPQTKKKRFILKPEIAIICVVALVLVSIPLFNKNNGLDIARENHFTIKADDDYYKIEKSTIEYKNFDQLSGISGWSYDMDKGTETYPTSSPLNVYFKGDNIKSITYTIEGGKFYKINEANLNYDDPTIVSEVCYGCFGMPKEENTFPSLIQKGNTIPGDPNKKDWWFYDNSDGNTITIDYDKQGTIDALYGISFTMKDNKLVNAWFETLNEADSETGAPSEKFLQVRAELREKIKETINNTVMNVRVDYNDGTYETTQLKFKVDTSNKTKISE